MGNLLSNLNNVISFVVCLIRSQPCILIGCECSFNNNTSTVSGMNRMMLEEGDIVCNSNVRAVRMIVDARSANDARILRTVFRCVPPEEQEQLHVHSTITTTMDEDYPTNDNDVPVFLAQIVEADNNFSCHVKNGIVACDGFPNLDVTVCCPNPSSGLLLHMSGYSNASGTGDIAPFTLDFGVTISNDSKNVLFRDRQSRRLTANPMEVNCRQPTDYPFDYMCTSVSDHTTAMTTTDTLYVQF